MTHDKKQKTVAVIGAGIIGVTTALRLSQRGFQVKLIEPGDIGGEQAASYGNGAWISPASIIPMTGPGIWKKAPGYLLDPTGPLTIRPLAMPRLVPWLLRFVRAGSTKEKVARTATILNSLIHDAPERHLSLAKEIGKNELIEQRGLLYIFPSRTAFDEDAFSWNLRRENGVEFDMLEGDALRKKAPEVSDFYQFGVYVRRGTHTKNPGAYTAAIAAYAKSLGVDIIKAQATSFIRENDRLQSIVTDHGIIKVDYAVISAGIHSAELARKAGDKIPLESERGYHIEISNPGIELEIPIMPSDGKMGNTMIGSSLRAAGQVELCSIGAAANWKRVDILVKHLLKTYPTLKKTRDQWQTKQWMGHRPSTPDGLPVIGKASGLEGVYYAFGHGHVGLNAAPKTAELVTNLLLQEQSDLSMFAPTRF